MTTNFRLNFRLLGPAHLLILGAVVSLAAALALAERRLAPGTKWLRIGLGVVLLADSAFWYSYLAATGQRIFPSRIPLELCDLTLYLVAIALVTLSPAWFDVAYYWALAGSGMALLTPDLKGPFPSVVAIQFFVQHGLSVCGVLYLVWSGQARPRPGSVARTMIAVNVLAAFDGVFDWVFKTDYMYLCIKPASATLLSFLGAWPWYIAASEPVALLLFLLLYLPFGVRRRIGAGGR